MKISRIEIKGLYGAYSYEITELQCQNLMLLTGYNGMGKTTILNIIKNIADSNLWYFYNLTFDEIFISFEGGLALKMSFVDAPKTIIKTYSEDSDGNVAPEKYLKYEWFKDGDSLCRVKINRRSFYKAVTVLLQVAYVPEDDDTWIPLMKNRMKDIVSFISKRQNAMSLDMIQSSVKAFMIPAQRVKQLRLSTSYEEDKFPFIQTEPEKIDTIEVVAENFGKLLEQKRIEFLKSIQSSKNGLMDRLLNADTEDIGKSKYEELAINVQEKIDDLSQFGIAFEKIRPYNHDNGKLLSAYLLELRDTLEKYSGLLNDLKLFASILNKKHFLHKTISFSPDYGFKAFNDNGASIDSSKLSSGEQNIIILLYQIIFEVQDGTILLIDEPEISMHVVWLKEFIKDLQEIAKNKQDVQIMIATHSPQIVSGAIDNCFDLEMNNIYGK